MPTLAEMALANTLRDRLAEPLGGPVTVHGLAPLHGGDCQMNFRVEVAVESGPREGRHEFALRGDPPGALPESLPRAREYEVARAAGRAGVRTPAVLVLLRGLFAPTADAYLMDFAPGTALGPRVVREPALELARTRLPLQLAESLATLHQITPATHPDLPVERPPFLTTVDPVEAQLLWLQTQSDALPAKRPAAALGLRWLREHLPVSRELTLVHGDFRTGNFLVTEQGLSAILDWELAHWGNPLEDIAWLCLRDWRFGRLDKPVGGFADLEGFLGAYVDLSGRPIRPADLHWWSVAGNLRWAAAALLLGRRPQAEIEHLALPRRAAEMEFEALRLIEVGP